LLKSTEPVGLDPRLKHSRNAPIADPCSGIQESLAINFCLNKSKDATSKSKQAYYENQSNLKTILIFALVDHMVTVMTPELIRSVWTLIEDFPLKERIKSNSEGFICQMIESLINRGAITPDNADLVRDYLSSRMLLIQEYF
jgi:hypothetical protein